MKTSLNGAGLNAGKLSFAQFVELAARHGFDGVDFGIGGAQKLADDQFNGDPSGVRDFLAQKNVAAATFGLDVEWRKDDAAFASGLAALSAKAAFAHAIGANRCCTWMPPAVNDDLAAWESQTVARFRQIARVLGDSGVRFGLEWVGPRHVREGPTAMGKNPWIHTLGGTLALIREIGEPNVGLLVDSYHCYSTGVGENSLAGLSDAQIVHVHINDAPPGVGPNDVRDGERVLPGAGDIDLGGFLSGLRHVGYSGFIAAEVLSPQPLADDPETAAARVRAALKTVGL
jgi:sugar phosphate isomerase/epimerase